MNPAIVGALKLLDFVENLGRWIREHLAEAKDVNVKGGVTIEVQGEVKVVLDLGSQLEGVIREILKAENKRETPAAYWTRATRELIGSNEQKFKMLHQLGVTNYTLGIEALTQDAGAVPEAIKRVMGGYVERYIRADARDETSEWELSASPLSDVLEAAERNTSPGSSPSLMDRLGGWPIPFELSKERQDT